MVIFSFESVFFGSENFQVVKQLSWFILNGQQYEIRLAVLEIPLPTFRDRRISEEEVSILPTSSFYIIRIRWSHHLVALRSAKWPLRHRLRVIFFSLICSDYFTLFDLFRHFFYFQKNVHSPTRLMSNISDLSVFAFVFRLDDITAVFFSLSAPIAVFFAIYTRTCSSKLENY